MKLFKTACLSYKQSDVTYRDQQMTREQLVQLRRDLIDKVTCVLPSSSLFRDHTIYPRRHFDDLVLESKITEQKVLSKFDNKYKGTENASKVF